MKNVIIASVLLVSAFVSAEATDAVRPAKPNVVLLLTDDLGWQDVKCYDIDAPSPYETPNIDALAKKGVMFWQAYSPAPTCAPTRCAIMSGNHPARAQKTHVVGGAPPRPNNKERSRMMTPWYSGRMPAIDHQAYPQPEDQGFDYTRSNRGTRTSMKDRLAGFATDAPGDPYRLDENSYPFHQNNEDALNFLKENKGKPFFLYYATWLVHSPIHTRSKALLDKYVEKIGTDPRNVPTKDTPGQLNPFYAAMVQELDYYVGIIFDYLDKTEDPRWPGHMLSENTYLIFTSDNGGMEGNSGQRYTDNNPLDKGKIHAREGGTRVPLLIRGPSIPAGVQSEVIVNGLDFYPTILSLAGVDKPKGKHLDGCDISPLLLGDPTNPELVRHADGTVRDTMIWHFPHGSELQSTIRIGDYKLLRNYDHINNGDTPALELYRLYETKDGKQKRVDFEEAKNLADSMPEKAQKMNDRLTEILTEMKASYPYYNPDYRNSLPNKEKVCAILSHEQKGDLVEFTYKENGAKVVRADLIYTLNGGQEYEEWFRGPATLLTGGKVSAQLPKGTTHYLINLIDENNFLRSYPEVGKSNYSEAALKMK